MAGDWIKFEVGTPDKYEVMAITAEMGWDDPDLTVGKLLRVWRWFDQQTIDGNARGVSAALLDRIVLVVGFAKAMENVGWLEIYEGGVSLPNFGRHNGETAKSRALTAKRVAKHKANARSNEEGNDLFNGGGNGESVTDALPREEKKREEKKETKHQWAAPDWVPADAWKDFEQMRVKRKKPLTDRARNLAVGELTKLRDAGHDVAKVIEQTVLHSWDTFYPLKSANGNGGSLNGTDARYVN